MDYFKPVTVSVIGLIIPLRVMNDQDVNNARQIIKGHGLEGVLEVKMVGDGDDSYAITAGWEGPRTRVLNASKGAFLEAVASILDNPDMMNSIGFQGFLTISNDDRKSTKQHLSIKQGRIEVRTFTD